MRVNAAWTRLCAFGASLFSVTLAIGLTFATASRAADTYPEHKVRALVPFAAGGPTDVIARLVADRLSAAWGQQLYVENLPGAGGNLGVENGARAAPRPASSSIRACTARSAMTRSRTSRRFRWSPPRPMS
jgi:tripartite-type tricarboxylate transporter receptor subunit TctC